jgi:hypothetical protein
MAMTLRAIETPIVIFSFDRPHYLRRLCQSLKAQQGVELDERRIILVQDGAVSRHSGVRYAEEARLAESVEVFRESFPAGKILRSEENLGIAFNIRRGEALVFETMKAELGYFFEDDLELGPAYLLMMERLRDAVADRPEVGYFAVYGQHRSRPDQDKPLQLVGLEHHWGFGLRREAWQRIDAWLAPYFEILSTTDYPRRNDVEIFRFLQRHSMACDVTSQDALKALAAAANGIARVMTDVCFARYIGEKGASFSEAHFQRMGYHRTVMAERTDLALPALSAERSAAILDEQQQRFTAFRTQQLDRHLAQFAARNFNPERLLRRDDVDDLFRLLLDRLPEEESIYTLYVGRQTVRELRASIVNSRDFRARLPRGG